MPQAKPCSRPNCGQLVPLGTTHCNQHARSDNKRRANKSREHGLTTNHWRQLRRTRLHLDHHRCHQCGQPATTVHLTPHLAGDHTRARLEDLTSLCSSCHGTIDAPRAHTQTKGGRA
jgi:5-methylcytosine-specific restriction endonuclease McrA